VCSSIVTFGVTKGERITGPLFARRILKAGRRKKSYLTSGERDQELRIQAAGFDIDIHITEALLILKVVRTSMGVPRLSNQG